MKIFSALLISLLISGCATQYGNEKVVIQKFKDAYSVCAINEYSGKGCKNWKTVKQFLSERYVRPLSLEPVQVMQRRGVIALRFKFDGDELYHTLQIKVD